MSTKEQDVAKPRVNMWDTLPAPTGQHQNMWDSLEAPPAEESKPTNIFKAFGAGLVRGVTDVGTIIPQVNEISNRMKQFRGETLPTKITYGLGFMAGMFAPVSVEFAAANKIVRGLGMVEKLAAADKAADLTRIGKFTRGAITGALYGAGQHADDIQDTFKSIALNATIGGAGDIILPAAWAAIRSPFSSKISHPIEEILDQSALEANATVSTGTARKVPVQSPEGVAAHAQAMALLDDFDKVTGLERAAQRYVENQDFIPLTDEPLPPSLYTTSERRLALQLGLQSVDLPNLQRGEYKIIPTPHGDHGELSNILKRLPGIKHSVVKGKYGTQVVVAHEEDAHAFDTMRKEMEKYGFIRGQEVLHEGKKWIAIEPSKSGETIGLTQPGRKEAQDVKMKEVQFLPLVQDMTKSASVVKTLPLMSEFIKKHSLWPSVAHTTEAEGVQTVERIGDMGFNEALREFAAEKGLTGAERYALHDKLTKLQREVLFHEEPELAEVAKNLEREAQAVNPDGLVDTLASQKALTTVRVQAGDGNWYTVVKDATSGRVLSPMLDSEDNTVTWIRNYQVEPDDVVKFANPMADGVMPSAGVASVKPHTTAEVNTSDVRAHPLMNLFASLMPGKTFYQLWEDRLMRMGINNIKPYTQIFLPLARAKATYQREMNVWLRGGKLADGTEVRGLLQIFNPDKPPVREEVKNYVTDLVEKPRAQWAAFAKAHGLNEKEVQVAKELRQFYNTIFDRFVKDENINITADDFIENYFPHYRELSDAGAKESVIKLFQQRGTQVNSPALKFLSEYQRKGTMAKWDKDPFVVTMKYLRTGLSKAHLGEPAKAIKEAIEAIPEDSPDLKQLKKHVVNFYRLTMFGAPEAFNAINLTMRNVVKNLGISLSEVEQERVINTYLTLNYGAYLGFRPGLIIRNLSQMLVTGYPLLGGKYMTYGLKMVASAGKDAIEEARKAGAILTTHVPIPGEEQLYADINGMRKQAAGIAPKAERARRFLTKMTEVGMWGFTRADDINRAVVYFGQKRKIIDAWTKFGAGGEMEKFYRHSGLNYFGPSIKEEFNVRRAGQGVEEAAKFVGSLAAGDTQWIYQLGAGPSLFNHGVGRLAGQYGTWPAWFAGYLAQGHVNLQGVEKAIFIARNLAVHGALIAGGAKLGMNLTRWTGISSLNWMGGPAVDWFSDARDIVTGISPSGEATGKRTLALGKYGARDTGEGVSLAPSFLGGRIGMKPTVNANGEPDGVYRLGMQTFGAVTPGFLMLKDIYNATKEPTMTAKALRVLAIPQETIGYENPEMRIR